MTFSHVFQKNKVQTFLNPTSPNTPRFLLVFTEKFEEYETRNIEKLWTNVLKHIQKRAKNACVLKNLHSNFLHFSVKIQGNLTLFELVGFRKAKALFFQKTCMRKSHFLGRDLMVKLEEIKIEKMTNFKANLRLVKENNSAQVIPIYKAKIFLCKNMCKMLTKYS